MMSAQHMRILLICLCTAVGCTGAAVARVPGNSSVGDQGKEKQMTNTQQCNERQAQIQARRLGRAVSSDEFPSASEWEQSAPISFCEDWQGNNADRQRRTEVRVLWSPDTLFIHFANSYRDLLTFDDAESDGYRLGLWDRDVAEAFIQSDRFGTRNYKEFEVAPNGMWIDLDIVPGGHSRLHSGMRRTVNMDEHAKMWSAQLAIPMRAIVEKFDPAATWRVNFFRCEGREPERWYSAWQATKTSKPNFHVPEAFGTMVFK